MVFVSFLEIELKLISVTFEGLTVRMVDCLKMKGNEKAAFYCYAAMHSLIKYIETISPLFSFSIQCNVIY